ncbi:MAG: hypothetical protein IPL41_16010 [Micropruina sp.]|nr:hypothetical protein [Micropruina sp.]
MTSRSGRARPLSLGRIASWTVLALVGCAASVTFVFGDRISRGVALAALVAGTVLVCLLAWRESRNAERLQMAAELGQAMRHAEQLHAERARQRAVVRLLSVRMADLRDQLAAAGARSCQLQQQLSTLRGNHEALRVELELQAVLNPPATVHELSAGANSTAPWALATELIHNAQAVGVQRSA